MTLKTTKNLFLKTFMFMSLTVAVPFAAAEDGGTSGGGGGMIVVNGQLKLLTEAGVISNDELRPYNLSARTLGAVGQMIDLLELRKKDSDDLKEFIVGNANTFKQINSIDEKLKAEIRAAYSAVAKDSGANIPPHLVIIAAYSDRNHTYILPTFEQLSPLQQAKVLLHEATYRQEQSYLDPGAKQQPADLVATLKRVLKRDYLLEVFLRNVAQGKNEGRIPLLHNLMRTGEYAAFKKIQLLRGRPTLLSEVTDQPRPFGDIIIDRFKVMEMAPNDHEVAIALEQGLVVGHDSRSCPSNISVDKCYKLQKKQRLAELSKTCAKYPHLQKQDVWFFELDAASKTVKLLNCTKDSSTYVYQPRSYPLR